MMPIPKNAAERYANRIRDGIGICALCGATVYIIYPPHLGKTPVAGWHSAGHGVDHPSWETIHHQLPKPCPGPLLELSPVAGEH